MYRFKVLFLQAILIAGALSSLFSGSASELICGECDLNINCCSKWHQCGRSDEHCREENCIKGRCYPKCNSTTLSVSDIVTEKFWNKIAPYLPLQCDNIGFYTRDVFLAAADSYLEFASSCSNDVRKREIAAYFAHAVQETSSFCYINQINQSTFCEASEEYPCNPNKKYFGRGPLQLRWNYNYIVAGEALGFDGMNNPEAVARDAELSFKASFWTWMYRGVHSTFTHASKGFGETIRIITQGNECDGSNTAKMNDRVKYYKKNCNLFRVDPGDDLTC
ncbi:Glycoside hydrolase family 19 protein [Dioscorea alata]|uniref:Glycoside hydrolase family 19 protein n=1 Tax=Dioscorea alata TaxID=55571 RepID=A0ACB7VBC7_DIOAL|nr:Glycoside hydrolase family 19 protein [Dioscorea alata]